MPDSTKDVFLREFERLAKRYRVNLDDIVYREQVAMLLDDFGSSGPETISLAFELLRRQGHEFFPNYGQIAAAISRARQVIADRRAADERRRWSRPQARISGALGKAVSYAIRNQRLLSKPEMSHQIEKILSGDEPGVDPGQASADVCTADGGTQI